MGTNEVGVQAPLGTTAKTNREALDEATLERDRATAELSAKPAESLADLSTSATLTITQVASLLKIPVRTAYVLSRKRKIPGRVRELGRTLRFRTREVLAWLSGERTASGEKSR